MAEVQILSPRLKVNTVDSREKCPAETWRFVHFQSNTGSVEQALEL
jgi:hypothetical protein